MNKKNCLNKKVYDLKPGDAALDPEGKFILIISVIRDENRRDYSRVTYIWHADSEPAITSLSFLSEGEFFLQGEVPLT